MKRSEFYFDLPDELIAQQPLAERAASRLLCLDGVTGAIEHRQFADIHQPLNAGDLLVFNDTRVIPARLWGQKSTGGRLEILIERITGPRQALAHIRCSRSPRPGTRIDLSAEPGGEAGPFSLEVSGRQGSLFQLTAMGPQDMATILQAIGHMPLPPYIERADQPLDRERYQTVYAAREGAVAAPTAGLHFSRELLETLEAMGVYSTTITLHVGAGTFQPVRADEVSEHVMHSEYLEVSAACCAALRETRQRGGRVIAVGTTAVRALESATRDGVISPFAGDTDIFIYPGYRFASVDAMFTNFHLPESTLLMLVSAFAGKDSIMRAYAEAIERRYRFFSYGDAMFLTCREAP